MKMIEQRVEDNVGKKNMDEVLAKLERVALYAIDRAEASAKASANLDTEVPARAAIEKWLGVAKDCCSVRLMLASPVMRTVEWMDESDLHRLRGAWLTAVGPAGKKFVDGTSGPPTVAEACERTFLMVPLLLAEVERLQKQVADLSGPL